MKMDKWKGEPKWNGTPLKDINIEGCVFAIHPSQGPLLLLIDNCEDYFLPIFSNTEKLGKHVVYLQNKGFGKFSYITKKIDDGTEFLESVMEGGVRIMLDPEVVNNHHTRWKEVIRSGDEWKFVGAESDQLK